MLYDSSPRNNGSKSNWGNHATANRGCSKRRLPSSGGRIIGCSGLETGMGIMTVKHMLIAAALIFVTCAAESIADGLCLLVGV